MSMRFPVLLLLFIVGCAAESSPIIYLGGDPNANFGTKPNELSFVTLTEGQEIVLNSAIAMPHMGEQGSLTIEFRRADLTDAFIRGFFFGEDRYVRFAHPFASMGIEAILTDERMILNVDPGVVIHMRNDMKRRPNFQTFVNDNVFGRVVEIEGDVYYCSDREIIRKELNEFFVTAVGPNELEIPGIKRTWDADGNLVLIPPPDVKLFPDRYPPRVIKGP